MTVFDPQLAKTVDESKNIEHRIYSNFNLETENKKISLETRILFLVNCH